MNQASSSLEQKSDNSQDNHDKNKAPNEQQQKHEESKNSNNSNNENNEKEEEKDQEEEKIETSQDKENKQQNDKKLEQQQEHKEKIVATNKQEKVRLILGEADFSYTLALLKKHPKMKDKIIATELRKKEQITELYKQTAEKNIQEIEKDYKEICQLEFEVDATNIHKKYENQRFQRIHFNCPHDGKDFKQNTLPGIISQFFNQASSLQQIGDRIHVALPYLINSREGERRVRFGGNYGICEASYCAGYKLIKIRKFFDANKNDNQQRFPGYQHRQTNKNESADETTQLIYEYIFEKYATEPQKDMPSNKLKQIGICSMDSTALKRQIYYFSQEQINSTGSSDYDEEEKDYDNFDGKVKIHIGQGNIINAAQKIISKQDQSNAKATNFVDQSNSNNQLFSGQQDNKLKILEQQVQFLLKTIQQQCVQIKCPDCNANILSGQLLEHFKQKHQN